MPIDWEKYSNPPTAGRETAYDVATLSAMELPAKLDRGAHASLDLLIRLVASTNPETAEPPQLRAAVSAAQTILNTKLRVAEIAFKPPPPDRSAEHLERWEALKAEFDRDVKESAGPGKPPSLLDLEAVPAVPTVPTPPTQLPASLKCGKGLDFLRPDNNGYRSSTRR